MDVKMCLFLPKPYLHRVPGFLNCFLRVADSESGFILTPVSGMGKRSGSGINIPDFVSESIETIFGLKMLKFCDADPDPGSFDSGSCLDPG